MAAYTGSSGGLNLWDPEIQHMENSAPWISLARSMYWRRHTYSDEVWVRKRVAGYRSPHRLGSRRNRLPNEVQRYSFALVAFSVYLRSFSIVRATQSPSVAGSTRKARPWVCRATESSRLDVTIHEPSLSNRNRSAMSMNRKISCFFHYAIQALSS